MGTTVYDPKTGPHLQKPCIDVDERREHLIADGSMIPFRYKTRMRERVLIVSENDDIKQMLIDALQADATHIYCAASVRDAFAHFIPENVTLVIIDLQMSETSGINLLKMIYEQQPVPLIAVSSNPSIQEEIQALEYGADRYLAKPLIKERFLAHKRSLMRRYWLNWEEYTGIPRVLSFENGLKVNFQTRTAYWRGTRIELRPKSFLLFARLAESNGEVVPKEQLYNDVWGCEYDKDLDAALKFHINSLRSALSRHRIAELVQMIWGRGVSPVHGKVWRVAGTGSTEYTNRERGTIPSLSFCGPCRTVSNLAITLIKSKEFLITSKDFRRPALYTIFRQQQTKFYTAGR